jgi:hypothetical protein
MRRVLCRLLEDPASRAGIDRLILRKLRRSRQRASVHLLMDDKARQWSLPGVGAGRLLSRGICRRLRGLPFPKAAIASRIAWPVRANPIAVGGIGRQNGDPDRRRGEIE